MTWLVREPTADPGNLWTRDDILMPVIVPALTAELTAEPVPNQLEEIFHQKGFSAYIGRVQNSVGNG